MLCMIIRFLFILCLIPSVNAEQYHFAAISDLYEQKVGEIILTHVYQKMGIDIQVTGMPGNRAAIETTKGRVDGEIMRIWSYGIDNPDVIRVPTPYYFLETMAFYKEGSDVVVNSAEDLAKYSVLKVRGVKHTNIITKGLDNVYDYDDTKSMLNALDEHRSNVALTHKGDGVFAISQYKIEHVIPAKKPLAVFSLYHYIHKKNAHLVERVNRILLDMKKSGELNTLILKAEKQVFES